MNNEQALQRIEEAPQGELPAIVPIEAKTSQQARIDEVTEALLPAYQKASELRLSDEENKALLLPFVDEAVEIRPHDGLLYIPHIHISDRLIRVLGAGQWAMVRRREWIEGNRIYAEYVMKVRGCFVGESVGAMDYHPSNARMNYSDALEGTRGECIRRIAAKDLGCGSQVWNPEYCRQWIARYAEQVKGKWQRKAQGNTQNRLSQNAPQNDELERIADDLMQMRQRGEAWTTNLSGMPPELHKRMEVFALQSYESRTACKTELSKLFQSLIESGQTCENALRSLRRCTGANASSRLQQSASGSMAMQGASSPSTQTVSEVIKPKEPPKATEKTRTWFLAEMRKCFSDATLLQWAMDYGPPYALRPDEGLEDFPLESVPTTKEALQEKVAQCSAFMGVEPFSGEPQMPAETPQKPAGASGPPSSSQPQAKSASKGQPEGKEHHSEAWYQFPMPFGKNAGTILGKLAKNYLYGLWKNYVVETEYNGKPKKKETIEADRLFRVMLDQAGVHYRFDEPKGGSDEADYEPGHDEHEMPF